ncbi:hypothetical protein SEVIR_4G251200v4 [Setaria viridis]
MGGDVEGKTTGGSSVDHAAGDKKPIKKKVIKKVMKVVRKKPAAGASTSADKSSIEDKNVVAESASKTAEVGQNEQKSEDAGKEQEGTGINQQPEAKKTGKKKIIRRVVKRKVSASGSQLTASATPAETSKQEAEIQPEKKIDSSTDAGNSQTKLQEGSKTSMEDISNLKKEEKPEEKETDLRSPNGDKVNHKEAIEQKDTKKDGKKEKTKDDKEKNRDLKMDPKQKPLNEMKEKKKSDDPPKYPGFILQAKRSNNESKLRSTSLSLDGLLDYTAKDIEESVFELSLFAESFSEMLQHRMGCVILSFLEKLYKRHIVKRNQRKRQREEDLKKEEKKSSEKRPKTTQETVTESADNPAGDVKMTKEGDEKMSPDHSASVHDEQLKEGQVKVGADHPMANHDEPAKKGEEKMSTSEAAPNEPEADTKMDEEDPEYEEDPEEIEIYEDDEDMDDAHAEAPIAEQNEDNTKDKEAKPEVAAEDSGNNKTTKEPESENITNIHEKTASVEEKQTTAEKGDSVEGGEKVVSKEVKPAKDEVVDKDLLQAFRYFDQNRAGYIKVDDLKCILHNLGKFLSSRDVKDLVQIALIESNSSRDNRIIYPKLVKIVDL